MNYLQAIAYIESILPTLLDPSLDRFREFMREAGDLQNSYPSIHVAGTNGKGSVVAMIDSVCSVAGLKTGRFTGPHLLRFNERFHLNGQAISDLEFAKLATKIRDLSEDFGRRHSNYGPLTWFEFLSAMAFYYFAENKVDCAVVEVGLGGTWDATNVIKQPLVSIIVSVGLDHTQILGETIREIAREKAGIVKTGVPVVTGCQNESLEEIVQFANKQKSPLIVSEGTALKLASQLDLSALTNINEPIDLELLSLVIKEKLDQAKPKLALLGPYQESNAKLAAIALALCDKQKVFSKQLLDVLELGLELVFWPGRCQFFKQENLLLDGAHNESGALALRAALDELFPKQARKFVLSFYQNKKVPQMIEHLLSPGDIVYASEAEGRRPVFASSEILNLALKAGCTAYAFPRIEDAFAAAMLGSRKKPIIGTGSFATVKSGLLFLGFRSVEDSIKASCHLSRVES